MKTFKERSIRVVLLTTLLLFAACKGETPTAPPPGGGGPGGTPPPQGVTIVLATSNANPLVDSTVVVTATVTQNGAAVANGTAVEFSTTNGVLDGSAAATIKTTTNGVATVTLSSGTPGLSRVTATVNNVTRTTDVTFLARPVTEPEPNTAPTISAVTPAVGRPSGGETILISGTNFKTPVRVLFDTGGITPIQAFVVSVTATQIEVITPSVNLGAGQQLEARIIVITEAGTSAEQRVARDAGFTFRSEQLEPRVSTASPNSGPVTGGTIVTIFGEGFQYPVQVLFGSAEARVIDVKFAQILVEAPAGRDTSPNGSGTVVGPVDISVRNILSNTVTVMPSGFRYVAAMQITAVGPTEGLFTGGTDVTIDGIGFVAPVAVTIGGVAAQPISVSGTKVIARTSGVTLTGCADVTGPVVVTNIVNGDQASGANFIYRVPKPTVIGVTPSSIFAGGNVSVLVANAQPGINRIKIGDRTLFPSSTTFHANGTATFVVAVPTSFEFPTEECTVGGVTGERLAPLVVDVTYENIQSTCADTAAEALTINPLDGSCVLPPAQLELVSPATGCTQNNDQITFRNAGGATLTIARGAVTGTHASDFTVSPASISLTGGQAGMFTVTFAPGDVGPRGPANVSFTSNGGQATVCLQGDS